MTISITVETNLPEELAKASKEIESNLELAGIESVNEILDTQGVRIYPPEGAGNQPPTPYYIRGVGTQTASGNLNNSQRYGASWFIDAASYRTTATNMATYGEFLADDETQALHMALIGWKKAGDAVLEKAEKVLEIFDKWIARALEKAGLS